MKEGIYVITLLSYVRSIINHYTRIPIKPPGFNFKVRLFFFRGSLEGPFLVYV